jgi:hypothetical protein
MFAKFTACCSRKILSPFTFGYLKINGLNFPAEEIETEDLYYDGGEKEVGNQHRQALVEIFQEKGERDK